MQTNEAQQLRVLFVEPDERDLEAFRQVFNRADVACEVTHCPRAEEALSRLGEDASSFDLVVADHKLPGISGLDLFTEMRKNEFSLPVVLVSDPGSEQLVVEALKAGVDNYILKATGNAYPVFVPILLLDVVRKFGDHVARKKAEEELRASQTELYTILQNVPLMMVVVDREYRLRKVNDAAVRFARVKPEELIGSRTGDALKCLNSLSDPGGCGLGPACEVCRVRRTVMDTFETGESHGDVEAELPFDLGEGRETRNLLISTAPFSVGGREMVLVCLNDITDRKRAEKALRQRTHDLGERVKELNCLYGLSWLVEKPEISLPDILQGLVDIMPSSWQYPDATCARITFEGEEFRTDNFKITPWRQAARISAHGGAAGTIEVCYLEKKPEIHEGPFVAEERDLLNALAERLGSVIERVRVASALRKAHDQLERRVEERTAELSVTNVRLRREVDERRRAQESLGKAQENYQSLVDTIDGIVWEADAQTFEFSFVSKKAERLLGYPVERWLNDPTFWKDSIHPDDREVAVRFCRDATARKEDHEFDFRMIAADGRVVWLRDIVTVVVENDRPVKLRGVMVDITQMKLQAEALFEARSDATVGRLAASVAHEVNNPLAAIKTQLSILREDVSEAVPQASENLKTVSGQVDRIARTVQNLLGFARQRSGAVKDVPLQEVVRTVAGLFKHAFEAKGIRLEIFLPEDLPTVRGDAGQLQEVFVNLFENARDLLGSDHVVSVRAEVRRDEVEVCVEDNGPGLGDDPEKVLEPFYTTRPNGVGIGLSIALKICRAHGGRLLAENRPAAEGGGARFRTIFSLAASPVHPDSVEGHEGTDR